MANTPFIFFGSSIMSTMALDELEKRGRLPVLVVTTPDKPKGRSMKIAPNVVKEWATAKNIPCFDPAKLDNDFVNKLKIETDKSNVKVFIVASYGKIIPKTVIDLAEKGVLNIHPSLLPKYRGATPLQSAILDDEKKTGVSIMKIDEQMDHGAIVAAKEVEIKEWPVYEKFEEDMARIGAGIISDTLHDFVSGKIIPKEQDHTKASYTKKISKADALIDLSDDPYFNFRKIQAYHVSPQAYFIQKKSGQDIRVKVTEADFKDGKLIIKKVIPEGKREMNYSDFIKGIN